MKLKSKYLSVIHAGRSGKIIDPIKDHGIPIYIIYLYPLRYIE